ncbi:hypothetical protein Sru01_16660 [Sphaerisporangium rufum]|uniref:Uncharacterized protein n=1 Tax=Sphaerisporangium rufum TaxID=1381558 RepID=A0A919QZ18_9ACTN|nr:hypothetical protein [Sphaerisporangium rufum]GII76684.1 hypothetical protein Sru01_16660 [Sphaerisporangium rufum]
MHPDSGVSAEELHPMESEMAMLKARVDRLEQQVRTLAEATAVLARGLESGPLEEAGAAHSAQAARLAHELLLAADLVRPQRDRG